MAPEPSIKGEKEAHTWLTSILRAKQDTLDNSGWCIPWLWLNFPVFFCVCVCVWPLAEGSSSPFILGCKIRCMAWPGCWLLSNAMQNISTIVQFSHEYVKKECWSVGLTFTDKLRQQKSYRKIVIVFIYKQQCMYTGPTCCLDLWSMNRPVATRLTTDFKQRLMAVLDHLNRTSFGSLQFKCLAIYHVCHFYGSTLTSLIKLSRWPYK